MWKILNYILFCIIKNTKKKCTIYFSNLYVLQENAYEYNIWIQTWKCMNKPLSDPEGGKQHENTPLVLPRLLQPPANQTADTG